MPETVLTTRRATRITPLGRIAGRLRVSDRSVRFVPADGSAQVEVALSEVRRIAVGRIGRARVSVDSAAVSLRLRCFGAADVARLLQVARSAEQEAGTRG